MKGASCVKKLLACLLCLLILCSAVNALGEKYQQHLANNATFETLEEAHAGGPAALAELTGRVYKADPALDTYPAGTTFVYRSAQMYTNLSAALRMNTNILVFVNQHFENKDDAQAYLKNLGVLDLVDKSCGSALLVTPINAETGFGAADQYAYFQLQSAMCNLNFSERNADKSSTYYADNAYFGGLTYRYLLGVEDGASFINDYIAPVLDDISRVAGMLLYGGKMADISQIAGLVPVYLVNASDKTAAKYIAANDADAYKEDGNVKTYFNQARPQQAVCVAASDALTADLVKDAYDNFLTHAMRVPVLRAGQNNGNMLYANYNFNQAPYTLSKRVPIFDNRTENGIIISEHVGSQFSDDGATEQTWYELVPEEVLNGTAPEHSVVLWLSNHGGGDDAIQYIDEIGLLKLAGEKRQAIIGGQNLANPKMVQYMLDKYPALDPSRVYTMGYSMGGGNTFRVLCENPGVFAAGVPMAAVTYSATDEQKAAFKTIDLPVMLLTSTYDYFYDWVDFKWRASPMCDYPTMLNAFLSYNEMKTIDNYDMASYPLHGFAADTYQRITLNNEYTNHTWTLRNNAGIPMVALTVTEFLPHGLYPEYAELCWNFCKHYARNVTTCEVIYNAYAE